MPPLALHGGPGCLLDRQRLPLARGLFIRLDGHAVRVMAIDGQPAEPFLARDGRVGLGPGTGCADVWYHLAMSNSV